MPVAAHVLRHAAERPHQLALRGPGGDLSYAELARQAVAGARHLYGLGVRRDSLVAISLADPVAMLTAVLAVDLAGATPLICDPAWDGERRARVMDAIPVKTHLTAPLPIHDHLSTVESTRPLDPITHPDPAPALNPTGLSDPATPNLTPLADPATPNPTTLADPATPNPTTLADPVTPTPTTLAFETPAPDQAQITAPANPVRGAKPTHTLGAPARHPANPMGRIADPAPPLGRTHANDPAHHTGWAQGTDLAWACFTSGSTGRPRAVVRTRASWTESFQHLSALTGIGPDDVVLVPGPLVSSLYGFAAVHALATGATAVVPGRWSLAQLDECTVIHLVPHRLPAVLDWRLDEGSRRGLGRGLGRGPDEGSLKGLGRGLDGTPGQRPAERPNDRPDDRPGQGPDSRPSETPAETPGQRPAERPGKGPNNRPGDRPGQGSGRTLGDTADQGPREGSPRGLRMAVVGGAALDVGARARAREAGTGVVSYYGATELSFVAADPDGTGLRPFPGVEVQVREGEVWVRSPWLAEGYLAGATGPLRKDPDGWMTVGDLAEPYIEGGVLTVRGRGDGAIQTGGATVVPEDVEEVLRRVPGVSDAVVVGSPHPYLGSVVTAVVEGTGLSRAALEAEARAGLDPAQRPRRWYVTQRLPRNPTGKPARATIATLLAEGEPELQRLAEPDPTPQRPAEHDPAPRQLAEGDPAPQHPAEGDPAPRQRAKVDPELRRLA